MCILCTEDMKNRLEIHERISACKELIRAEMDEDKKEHLKEILEECNKKLLQEFENSMKWMNDKGRL